MGKQARLRRARKWRLATNEIVASCADPSCTACEGRGIHQKPVRICGCAPPRFKIRFAGRMRRKTGQLEVQITAGEAA